MKFFFAVTDGNLASQDSKTSREQRETLFKKLTKKALPSLRIRLNQSLSRFSLIAQAQRKAPKETPIQGLRALDPATF